VRLLSLLICALLGCGPRGVPSSDDPAVPVRGDRVDAAVTAAAPIDAPPPPAWVDTTRVLYREVAGSALDAAPATLAASVLRAVAHAVGGEVEVPSFATEVDDATAQLAARLTELGGRFGGDDPVVVAAAMALADGLGPRAAVISGAALAETPAPQVSHRVVRGVGVVRISAFTADAPIVTGLRAVLADLDRRRVRGLVFDLRAVGGTTPPRGAISLFTNHEVLWREQDTAGVTSDVTRDGEIWPTERPIAVLVNAGTTAAAEQFAFALQDLDIGYLIGQPTAGVLTATTDAPLPGGAVLRYPARRVVGVVGGKLASRVTPSVRVEDGPANTAKRADAQLAAAIADVRKRIRTGRVAPPRRQ
jgi:hypothetical protein